MKTINLAIVDDHKLFREGIKSLLKTYSDINFLFEATNGIDLFNKVQHHKPDIILLDLDMEEMNGIEATKKLQTDYPQIRLIILSMHKEDRMISYMMEIGANAYLMKDTDQDELIFAIRSVYEKGLYFNPNTSKALLSQVKQKLNNTPSLKGENHLTKRELDVLKLIAAERTTAEIASTLFLSVRTIEGYRKNLLHKLGAKNTAGLIIKAIQDGLISL